MQDQNQLKQQSYNSPSNKKFSYSTLLQCSHCVNNYKNRNDFLLHESKCNNPLKKENFSIINGDKNLDSFIIDLELKYDATLNKTKKIE